MSETDFDRVAVPLYKLREDMAERGERLSLSRNKLAHMDLVSVIDLIWDTSTRDKMRTLILDRNPYFYAVCAGASWHHYWKGGLQEHCKEMIGWCFDQLDLYPEDWKGVSRDDVLITCLLHDFAKVWSYKPLTEEEKSSGKYKQGQEFRTQYSYEHGLMLDEFLMMQELAKINFQLTDNQLSAIIFAEGGYGDYVTGFASKPTFAGDNVMHRNKLAVMLHCADLFSSQILSKSLNV